MTTQDAHTLINLLHLINQNLQRMADALEQLAPPPKPPEYERSLDSWHNFDWASIGATVERHDSFGPAIILWRGRQFIRRSPTNKYKEAIWFSRCTGKDANGQNQYECLITFRSAITVEPLPEKVLRLVR